MWPNRIADGNTKTKTPGLLSEHKENELEENGFNSSNTKANFDNEVSSSNTHSTTNTTNNLDEFPILDELDRLAKVFNLKVQK